MNRNESHALSNILQAAIGYIEMGRSEAAVKTLLDAQLVIGLNAIVWNGKKQEYILDRGYTMKLEGLPDAAVYVEVHHITEDNEFETPRAFALPCSTAIDVAEQMIAYCHASASQDAYRKLRRYSSSRLAASKDSERAT